jgi:hypothetical protein
MYPMGAEEPALGVTRSTTGVVAARVVDGLSSGGFMAASSDPGVKRTEWTDEGECAERSSRDNFPDAKAILESVDDGDVGATGQGKRGLTMRAGRTQQSTT